MPVKRMTRESRLKKLSRVMVFGQPNSFKTTACIMTSVYPMVIISVPGEHGYGTIPEDVPGLISLVWENDAANPQTSESIKREVETEVKRVLAGEYDKEFGKIRTLVIDGYHKMYNVYLNIATAGSYNAGEDFKAQMYARAHRMSDAFLDLCLDSPMEYVTFTAWTAPEADKPGSQTSHLWPALPGKAAQEMVGKFSVVCSSKVTNKRLPDGRMVGEWGLKPDSEVWGNSVKMDPRLLNKLPATCPQNFKELYKIVTQAQQAVEAEGDTERTGTAA